MSDRVGRAGGVGGAFSKFSEVSQGHRRGLLGVVCAVILCTALGPLLAQQISGRRTSAAGEPGSVDLVRKRAEWFFASALRRTAIFRTGSCCRRSHETGK